MGRWLALAATCAALVAGCVNIPEKIGPLHDEVLRYNLPYDLTFLRALEGIDGVQGWKLAETEKEHGIIRAYNVEYSQFGDQDEREATVVITRVSREVTTVALAPYSQRVHGADKLLEAVNSYVTREL